MRPPTLVELAAENGAPVPKCLRDGQFHFSGFEDFIAQYETVEPCLAKPADFSRIAYEFCEDEAAQGVR
jgi:adenosine deaminase